MSRPTTIGVIVGNRGFFPSHLCSSGRAAVLAALEAEGLGAVALAPEATPFGAVESLADARACADLFHARRDEIDGVLVTLPNFGDERAVANTLRWADLGVPVLVHAFEDDGARMTIADRRDSFCGKMSVCNNLRQYGIPFSLTSRHTMAPGSHAFRADLRRFAATCRVVASLDGARLGAVGARPAAFNTVRFSEKLLERTGISIETLDLSEVVGQAGRLPDDDAAVRAKLEAIQGYTATGGVPAPSLLKMAKFGVVVDRWMKEKALAASAIQCWTALQEHYGVVPCTLMSMMSESMLPSACETDVAGVVGMLVLQAASGRPAALLDWNNNFGDEPDKGVVFHCSNLPRSFFTGHRMDYQEIIAGTMGKDKTYGTIVGKIAPGPMTYCRVSTDDLEGRMAAYVGEGRFTDDTLQTFGGYGVIEIPRFQDLLQFVCRRGFEHHVAMTRAEVAEAVHDALGTYLGWDTYHHA